MFLSILMISGCKTSSEIHLIAIDCLGLHTDEAAFSVGDEAALIVFGPWLIQKKSKESPSSEIQVRYFFNCAVCSTTLWHYKCWLSPIYKVIATLLRWKEAMYCILYIWSVWVSWWFGYFWFWYGLNINFYGYTFEQSNEIQNHHICIFDGHK